MNRQHLQRAAVAIADRHDKPVSSPWQALRKLFVAPRYERRDGIAATVGWKRGELFELAEAVLTGGDWRSEWGDVGYYVAQTWGWMWALYALVTPARIIEGAVAKFEGRAGM
jgi:NTP pyrophosphatase (non-canonical NTP hydrolase)